MTRRRTWAAATGAAVAMVAGAALAVGDDERRAATVRPATAAPKARTNPEPTRGREDRAPRDTVLVPGGRHPIGAADLPDARPVHRVRVAPFRIGRHEVTNAEYARFLDALGVRPVDDAPAGAVRADAFHAADARLFVEGGEGEQRDPLIALDDEHARIGIRDGRFVVSPRWARHPVTEVTWEGARRYARWSGGRLPTEVEWEAAARGREGRTYPWGEAPPTPARAVLGRDSGETLPVGSRPSGATPSGVQDLAGNVDEWTSTLQRPYPYVRSDGREARRAAPAVERVTRGGNHVYSGPRELRAAYRLGFSRAPDRGHRHIGFRVVFPVR